jgi:cation diffusion facilitator CzcD-associated flavoprotein CzcO
MGYNTQPKHVPLLIIGAGPFGLGMAAEAKQRGIEHLVLGEPMSFWKAHMPKGMLLRSGRDWHLDPERQFTTEAFAASAGVAQQDIEPMPLDFYLKYAGFFQASHGIKVRQARVDRLDREGDVYCASIDDGTVICAD